MKSTAKAPCEVEIAEGVECAAPAEFVLEYDPSDPFYACRAHAFHVVYQTDVDRRALTRRALSDRHATETS